ncbi:YraN family protein [Flammeovirgaceae bacterium SG7u.111]|nr:YraN family protein [Flammeovirgaceae bacterium SG7u.132]WPO35759.1 YraN family protein [Flammeovirgaceae bacterium SG7u.111]
MKNQKLGDKGENLAAKYLAEKGYEVLYRNYRYKKAEIDIIATNGTLLVFVEVKTRSGTGFGFPEAAITPKKVEMMQLAAEYFMEEEQLPENFLLRFDVVSIVVRGEKYEIEHIEDAIG